MPENLVLFEDLGIDKTYWKLPRVQRAQQFHQKCLSLICSYRRSVGHLVLVSTNLVLEENMDVTGNLDCAGGECPASAEGAFFDFGQDQMCPNVADDGTVCAASVSFSCRVTSWAQTKTIFLHILPGLDFDKDWRVQQCCELESEESSQGKWRRGGERRRES